MSHLTMKPGLGYVVAVATASAAQANPITFGIDTVRLCSTTNCWVKLSSAATAADKTTSAYLPANVVQFFSVNPTGKESFTAIRDTADGTLSIVEMTR